MTEKPARGRPVKPASEVAKLRTIRLTDADFTKLKEIGMERFRAWIRKTVAHTPKV